MSYKLYNGDCLEIMKDIPDETIDLVLIDPPYNIGKAKWDKWDTVGEYVEFMGKVFLEIQRVLKNNGSFYFFHNDFLQIVELQNFINKNTEFKFKQLLIWNKRFNEASNKGFLDGFIEVEHLRNYQQMAEYCLFYTLQDEYIDKKLYIECVKDIQNYIKYLGCEEVLKSYAEVLELCDRSKYEQLRYKYNNQKIHHSVMNYEIVKKKGHITPKNTDMLEYLIKTSSNEGDLVLDCFMGSGSTGEACIKTKRNFIGIEKDEKYFKIAKDRLKNL